jgi:hypothetical protein
MSDVLANLTAVQQRCTELLEEKRALVEELEGERRLLKAYRLVAEILAGDLADCRELVEKLLSVIEKAAEFEATDGSTKEQN